MMLLNFFRYRLAVLLILFVSLVHFNGFSCQYGETLAIDGVQASDNRLISSIFHVEAIGVSTSFLNCDSRNSMMVIEESGLVQLNFPTVSKKRMHKIIDRQLIGSTVFHDYNYTTLSSSSYFAPVADLLLELCVFRL